MCGQSIAYNTYATLANTNPLFMGFSCSLNVNKEIICEQSHAKSSREFILLELFCCDYWRIDDDRAVAKRRGGSHQSGSQMRRESPQVYLQDSFFMPANS